MWDRARGRFRTMCCVLAVNATMLLTTRVLTAQSIDAVSGAPRSDPSGRIALGIALSTPGGPGLVADLRFVGPVALRGRWYGLAWGTGGRGVGLGLDLLHSSVISVSAMGLWGELRCSGDADSNVCSNSPGASQAWYAGGTAQFAVTADQRWVFGLEVGRWFTGVSDPLNRLGQQASRTMLAGVLKRFF